jgi:hypothetical protein
VARLDPADALRRDAVVEQPDARIDARLPCADDGVARVRDATPASTRYFGGCVDGSSVRAWGSTSLLRTTTLRVVPVSSERTRCEPPGSRSYSLIGRKATRPDGRKRCCITASKYASTSAPDDRLDMPALMPTRSISPLSSAPEATPYQAAGWCSRTKG